MGVNGPPVKSQTNTTSKQSEEEKRAKARVIEQRYRDRHRNNPDHKERLRKKSQIHRQANPGYHRPTRLQKLYGITIEERDTMLALQGGCCAVCGTDNPQRKNADWAVDHCHSTGKVRGILCHPCNLMLGHARDNSHTLAQAIHYLEKHNG